MDCDDVQEIYKTELIDSIQKQTWVTKEVEKHVQIDLINFTLRKNNVISSCTSEIHYIFICTHYIHILRSDKTLTQVLYYSTIALTINGHLSSWELSRSACCGPECIPLKLTLYTIYVIINNHTRVWRSSKVR